MDRISIADLINLKDLGVSDAVIEDLWYDWFCRDSSLMSKGRSLLTKLARIVKVNNGKFNPEKTYVFFKNNCPCVGKLYDDFRICDIESGDVIYTVIPNYRGSGKAELWGRVNDFKEPILENCSWKDIVEYFKS